METKANTALIGAFTLVVLALGFVFIYWLARGGEENNNLPLLVVFNDPVTGLATGSQVVFNGIKVGEVKRLSLDPQRPSTVVAELSVQTATPIKNDTSVVLGFQGLTGVGYVEMSGGSPDQPDIWEMESPAVLIASRSSMQDLLAGARTIMSRADQTLKTVEDLVAENADDVNRSIQNVQAFTAAIAENADGIRNFMEQASRASAGLADMTTRLQGIVERGEALAGAIDPAQVQASVQNVTRLTENLAARSSEVGAIIDRASAISASAEAFAQRLPALGEKTDAMLAAIDAEKVGRTVDRLDQIAAAVDPAQVQSSIANVASLTENLGSRSAELGAIVDRVSAISAGAEAFAQRLPALGERTDAVLAALDPEAVGRTVLRLDQITAAVEPERVRATVDGFASLSETLGANRDNIDRIVTRLSAITSDVSAFSPNLPAMGERMSALLAAVDAEKVGRTIDGAHQFATALGESSDDVDVILANARAVSERFDALSARAESLMAKLDSMAGGGTGGLIEEARATMAAIRAAAESIDAQTASIGEGLGRFSDSGLRDFQTLVSQGQRTMGRLDRVISDLERNPSGLIFGGESVPEYSGGRRR